MAEGPYKFHNVVCEGSPTTKGSKDAQRRTKEKVSCSLGASKLELRNKCYFYDPCGTVDKIWLNVPCAVRRSLTL